MKDGVLTELGGLTGWVAGISVGIGVGPAGLPEEVQAQLAARHLQGDLFSPGLEGDELKD